ncbi:hypothetical protein HOE67_04905 [Candidatus Peregrinibacteria bacterium]|jgi:hypothetical protein|nr:hypothetical protein [Candidatus Peregrinibacteria bacterium]MBT4056420.1 hypothetical protein [Candidatus Peregrinibacteria bacterium]
MTHKRYLTVIGAAGLFAWIAFVTVIFKFNPYESASLALAFFYVSLFIALSCTFTVLGYFFRLWLYRNEVFYMHINISLRQGILLSVIAVSCLILLMLNVLNWWSGMLLVIAATLLEFYFTSQEAY